MNIYKFILYLNIYVCICTCNITISHHCIILLNFTAAMPFTEDFYLPSEEELKVQEINVSTPVLKAGAIHFGKYCDEQCKVSSVWNIIVVSHHHVYLIFSSERIISECFSTNLGNFFRRIFYFLIRFS